MKNRVGKKLLLGFCLLVATLLFAYLSFPRGNLNTNKLNSEFVRNSQRYDGQVQAEIDAVWMRIEAFLAEKHPETLANLAPAATDEDIREFEHALGYQLPADFKASLKRHTEWPNFFSIWSLYSLETIHYEWQWRVEFATEFPRTLRLSDRWGHPGLIPFAGWDSDSIAIDLESGHVVTVDEIGDQRFEAESFRVWLTNIADRLESGDYLDESSDAKLEIDICGARWPDMFTPGSLIPPEQQGVKP